MLLGTGLMLESSEIPGPHLTCELSLCGVGLGITIDFYIYINIYNFIYLLIVGCLGLCCCAGFSLVAARRGYSLAEALGLLLEAVPLFAAHGFSGTGASIVAASGLSSCCFQALESRLNSCGTQA